MKYFVLYFVVSGKGDVSIFTVLQIRSGNRDTIGIIIHISAYKHIL